MPEELLFRTREEAEAHLWEAVKEGDDCTCGSLGNVKLGLSWG